MGRRERTLEWEKNSHTRARSHTRALAHTSCHNSLAGVKTTYRSHTSCCRPAFHTLISTYGSPWNEEAGRPGLLEFIRLRTWNCAYILTGRRGASNRRCPLSSRGEGVALGGSLCTETLHQSGCFLPGPAGEDEGGFDEEQTCLVWGQKGKDKTQLSDIKPPCGEKEDGTSEHTGGEATKGGDLKTTVLLLSRKEDKWAPKETTSPLSSLTIMTDKAGSR